MTDGGPAAIPPDVARLHAGLDRLSYYEFLGITPQCDYVGIREAFFGQANRYHPDRYVLAAPAVREAVYQVYKRMTEAYNVLSDPDLRIRYDAARRRGEVRLPDVERSRRRPPEERGIANPIARLYLRTARAKLARGDRKGAWIDAQLACSLELAPPLRALLHEVEKESP